MSGLYGLEPGFGDRNTFNRALLGLRSFVDQVAEVVPDPTSTGRSDGMTRPSGQPPADRPEPDRFQALVLGVLAVKDLLDDLVPPPNPDPADDDTRATTAEPGPNPGPSSGLLR